MIAAIAAAADNLVAGGAIQRALRKIGIGLLVLLAVTIAVRVAMGWHERRVEQVRAEAMAEQKRIDRQAFVQARAEAEARQNRIVQAAKAEGIRIGEEKAHALAKRNADIDRHAAALAGLWRQGPAVAGVGAAREGSTAGVPGAAGPADLFACEAQGWVSLPVAVELAAGADREAARGDALLSWIEAQRAAWPSD